MPQFDFVFCNSVSSTCAENFCKMYIGEKKAEKNKRKYKKKCNVKVHGIHNALRRKKKQKNGSNKVCTLFSHEKLEIENIYS